MKAYLLPCPTNFLERAAELLQRDNQILILVYGLKLIQVDESHHRTSVHRSTEDIRRRLD
jgi:hypothetical protein